MNTFLRLMTLLSVACSVAACQTDSLGKPCDVLVDINPKLATNSYLVANDQETAVAAGDLRNTSARVARYRPDAYLSSETLAGADRFLFKHRVQEEVSKLPRAFNLFPAYLFDKAVPPKSRSRSHPKSEGFGCRLSDCLAKSVTEIYAASPPAGSSSMRSASYTNSGSST